MLVVGDKEVENGTVSIRARKEGKGGTMSADEFVAQILEEIKNKEN